MITSKASFLKLKKVGTLITRQIEIFHLLPAQPEEGE